MQPKNRLPENWAVQCPEDHATNEGWKKVIAYLNMFKQRNGGAYYGNEIGAHYGMNPSSFCSRAGGDFTFLTIDQFLEMTGPEQTKGTDAKDWLDSEKFREVLSSFKGDDLHNSDVIDAIRANYFPPKPEEPPQQYEPGKYIPKFGEKALFWNGDENECVPRIFLSHIPQLVSPYVVCSFKDEDGLASGKLVWPNIMTNCKPLKKQTPTAEQLKKAREFLAKEMGVNPEQIERTEI